MRTRRDRARTPVHGHGAVIGHGHADRNRGRAWAYTGTVLGAAVSVAANVAHSLIPPPCAPVSVAIAVSGEHGGCVPWTPPSDWAPPPGAVVGSALWPILVVVAVEILTRVEWPPARVWLLARWGGLLPVALVAAVVSYGHGRGLLLSWGEGAFAAAIGPLAPDGLMVIAASALLIRRVDVVSDAVPDTLVPVVDTRPATVSVLAPVDTPCPVTPVPVLVDAPLDTPVLGHGPATDTATVPDTGVTGHAPEHGADTACTDTVPAAAPATDTGTDTPRRTSADTAPTALVPAARTPPAEDRALADTLRRKEVDTLRGAMKTLNVGQARARRVLALAWPE